MTRRGSVVLLGVALLAIVGQFVFVFTTPAGGVPQSVAAIIANMVPYFLLLLAFWHLARGRAAVKMTGPAHVAAVALGSFGLGMAVFIMLSLAVLYIAGPTAFFHLMESFPISVVVIALLAAPFLYRKMKV